MSVKQLLDLINKEFIRRQSELFRATNRVYTTLLNTLYHTITQNKFNTYIIYWNINTILNTICLYFRCFSYFALENILQMTNLNVIVRILKCRTSTHTSFPKFPQAIVTDKFYEL